MSTTVEELLRSLLPTVNAGLNGTCALLLVGGYLAVRSRRLILHKTCLLSALGISALFLASYLFYHLFILRGQHTTFRQRVPHAPDWVVGLYQVILFSHTLLALVAAPLALVTAFFGLRDRQPRHLRLGRWTLLLWLYVSVTGVVVYWMLYRF
jgi:uncharacterized membrane protein YozB (DUF420 family)